MYGIAAKTPHISARESCVEKRMRIRKEPSGSNSSMGRYRNCQIFKLQTRSDVRLSEFFVATRTGPNTCFLRCLRTPKALRILSANVDFNSGFDTVRGRTELERSQTSESSYRGANLSSSVRADAPRLLLGLLALRHHCWESRLVCARS